MSGAAVQIDGASGEGGGQIIRTSVALSALTGRNVELINIRARRSKPGLQAQHLTAVLAAAELCSGSLIGAELGSRYLRFNPGKLTAERSFKFDIAAARGGASAGATSLVAQTIIVPLCLSAPSPTAGTILGGTHVPMSPAADYLETVYIPALMRMGFPIAVHADRAGFFPKGGGRLLLQMEPMALGVPFEASERGRLKQLRLVVVTSGLPATVGERGRDALLKELKGYGVPIQIELREMESAGAGAAVVLTAECEHGLGGWSSLGERGKPMERVALEALKEFQRWFASGVSTDTHLADQLVLPASFVPETSQWTTMETTDHLLTVLQVVQQFLPIKYNLEAVADGNTLVSVTGVACQMHP